MADDPGGDVLRAYIEASNQTRKNFDNLLRTHDELLERMRESMDGLPVLSTPFQDMSSSGLSRGRGRRSGQRIADTVRHKLQEYFGVLGELGYSIDLAELWGKSPAPVVRLRVWRDPYTDPLATPREGLLEFWHHELRIEATITIDGGSTVRVSVEEERDTLRPDEDFLDVVSVEATVRLFMSRILSGTL